MSRSALNFLIDLLSALVGLGMVLTGLIMYFALPPGSRQMALWGLGRHDWGDIHSYLALTLVVLVVVHLALHWGWVCGFVYKTATRNPQAPVPARASLYGTVLLVLMLGLLAGFVAVSRNAVAPGRGLGRHAEEDAAGALPAAEQGHRGPGRGLGRQGINGSITLTEAASLTGQTPAELKQRLSLPADTPDNTRLREIADSKGWSMPELREKVTP